MATKTLKTRIQLKYDTYTNWNTNNPILLKGEWAATVIPTTAQDGSSSTPVVMLKVGDGVVDAQGNITGTQFRDLPWASALASDVYSWAKKENPDYNDLINTPNATIKFTRGKEVLGSFTLDQTSPNTVEIPVGDVDTNTQYQLVLSGHTLKLQSRELTNGVWGKWEDIKDQSFTLPDNDTTYTFAEGDLDGTFTVTPKNGSAQRVKIKNVVTTSGAVFNGPVTVLTPTADMNPATKQYVDSAIEGVSQFNYKVVTTLPTASADTMGTIYLVKHTHNTEPEVTVGTNDTYDEYLTIQNGSAYSWEKIGNTDIDLSGYYNSLLQTGSGVVTDVSEGASGQIMVTRTSLTTADPTASGTATDFIATVKQDANGKIATTKKSVATMTGATLSAAGAKGLVPAPASGDQTKFLRGDGTWADVDKANRLATSRSIDGVEFDGSESITHYGDCDTAAGTAEKTVICSWFQPVFGARIAVKFTNSNSASNPTLNVHGTGAKPIYYRGSPILATYLAANRTYEFIYNGTQYDLVGDINIDTNTAHGHSVGVGLVKEGNGGISGSVNYKVALADETRDTNAAVSRPTANAGRTYPVIADKNGNLATIVPWDVGSDTKNTAGSSNTSSKIYLIGATAQSSAGVVTYSHETAYVGTDGCLYSNSKKVATLGDSNSFTGLNTFKKTSTDSNTDYLIKLDNSSTTPNIVLGSAPAGSTSPTVYTKYGESAISKVSASGQLDFAFPSASGTLALKSDISDTKNTTGSSSTSGMMYLVGAPSQDLYSVTYSKSNLYSDSDGCLNNIYVNSAVSIQNTIKLDPNSNCLTIGSGGIGVANPPMYTKYGQSDIKRTSNGVDIYTLSLPSKTGTLATTDDITAATPDLSNYVTTKTEQIISGKKTFTGDVHFDQTTNKGVYFDAGFTIHKDATINVGDLYTVKVPNAGGRFLTGLTTTEGGGLKINTTIESKPKIDIDDTVTFILDCGNSTIAASA